MQFNSQMYFFLLRFSHRNNVVTTYRTMCDNPPGGGVGCHSASFDS